MNNTKTTTTPDAAAVMLDAVAATWAMQVAESAPARYVAAVDVHAATIRDALLPKGLVSSQGSRPCAAVVEARKAYAQESGAGAAGARKAIERLSYVAAICASSPRPAGLDEAGSAARHEWVLKVRRVVNTGLTLDEVAALVARGEAGHDPIGKDTPTKGKDKKTTGKAPTKGKTPQVDVVLAAIPNLTREDAVKVADAIVAHLMKVGVAAGDADKVGEIAATLGEVRVAS